MNSAEYNSDEFENLNDIETVLTKVGIKLRETAGTWRDIDSVIEDIAKKWGTWDQTTKNAVATVVAGTRQRENVITLFENWDNVAKYAEIAENAYGTATSKMSAYTESVEASQQRLTVAVEEWALKLNQSDAIKAFYDGLTFLVKNIHTVSLTLLGIASITNFDKVVNTFSSGLMKLSTKIMGFGNMFSGIRNTQGKITLDSFKAGIVDGLNQNYLLTQQEAYGRQLDSYTKVLGLQLVLSAKLMQTELLRMEAESRKTMATILSTNMTEADTQKLIENMSSKDRVILAESLLTQKILSTASFTEKLARLILDEIVASNKLELSEEELLAVTEQLIAQRRKMGATAGGAVGGNLANSAKTSAKTQLISGVASVVGMGLGAYGGGGAVELVGEKILGIDVGDTGKTLGTLLGGTIGMYAANSLATTIPAALAAGGSAWIPVIGPAIAAISLIAGGVYSYIKNKRQKEIKEAQEDFKELEQHLSNLKGLSSAAAKFDELSKGVDSSGRNVSLSEDEYLTFLDASNLLCKTLPELVGYIDEEGNAIARIGTEANSASEYVQGLIKDLQYLSDIQFISPEVMGPAMDELLGRYKEKWLKSGELLNEADFALKKVDLLLAQYDELVKEQQIAASVLVGTGDELKSSYALDLFNEDSVDGAMDAKKYARLLEYDKASIISDIMRLLVEATDSSGGYIDTEAELIDIAQMFGYDKEDIQLVYDYMGLDGWDGNIRSMALGENGSKYYYNLARNERNEALGRYLNEVNGFSTYTSPEDYLAEIDLLGKDIEKAQTEYDNLVTTDGSARGVLALEQEMSKINAEAAEYGKAYARTTEQYNGLTTKMLSIVSSAINNISFTEIDSEGNLKVREDYFDAVDSAISGIELTFTEHEELIDVAMKVLVSPTILDEADARLELKNALIDALGVDGFKDEEIEIMAYFGFKHDGTDLYNAENFEDTEDKELRLADALGVSKYTVPAFDWGLYDMNLNLYELVYKLARSGEIKVGEWEFNGYDEPYRVGGTSKETLRNLMRSDLSGGNTKEEALAYNAQLLVGGEDLKKRVNDFYDSFADKSKITAFEVAQNFSDMPKNMREAILQGAEDVDSAWSEIEKSYNVSLLESYKNVAKTMAQYSFSEIDAGSDGILGEWGEIKSMLELISNAYELLKNARKEYNALGKLSWQTTLDLLSTNEDYIYALEVENGKIKLKNDAEKIMAQVLVAAARANILAKIAEMQAENDELAAKITAAEGGEAVVISTNLQIDANAEMVRSLNSVLAAYAEAANKAYSYAVAANAAATLNASADENGVPTKTVDMKTLSSNMNKNVVTVKETLAYESYITWDPTGFDVEAAKKQIADNEERIELLRSLDNEFANLEANGYSGKFWSNNFDAPDLDGGNVKDELEKLKDLIGALNKEFYQMISYAQEGITGLEETAKQMNETYYKTKGRLLDKAIARAQVLLGGKTLEQIYALKDDELFDKYLGYYKDLQDLTVQRNNLDDEEIQDKITIAELEGSSLATMKDIYRLLLKTSDTYEEYLTNQKKYNLLLSDEYNLLKSNGELIDSKTFSRKVFAETGGSLLNSDYYQSKLNQILLEKKAILNILDNNDKEDNKAKLSEEDIIKYKKDLLDLDNQEADIKDEYLDKLKLEVESQNSSLDIRKDLQRLLINSADTYEELLQRQQEYNDLLKEEQDLRLSIASSLNDEYLAMKAFQSGEKTAFYDLKENALKNVQESIETRIINNKFATGEITPVAALESGNAPTGLKVGTYVSTLDGKIYEIVGIGENAFGSLQAGHDLGYNYNPNNRYWSKKTDYIANGVPLSESDYISLLSDQQSNYVDLRNLDDERIQHQINLLKGQKADLSAVTALYKLLIGTADTEEEFYDYYQQYMDAFIAEFDYRISNIQRLIDTLEKARPQEWKSTISDNGKIIESAESKIKSYYDNMDTFYKNQLSAAQEALKYSSELTKDEIEHLVDVANDAIKNIHDNAIARAEELKNYLESVYSALTNEVLRYIDDLEKLKEIVEETYDKELKKLQDKEDAIARTNKLIELQNNLLNAQKEKERVNLYALYKDSYISQ